MHRKAAEASIYGKFFAPAARQERYRILIRENHSTDGEPKNFSPAALLYWKVAILPRFARCAHRGDIVLIARGINPFVGGVVLSYRESSVYIPARKVR